MTGLAYAMRQRGASAQRTCLLFDQHARFMASRDASRGASESSSSSSGAIARGYWSGVSGRHTARDQMAREHQSEPRHFKLQRNLHRDGQAAMPRHGLLEAASAQYRERPPAATVVARERIGPLAQGATASTRTIEHMGDGDMENSVVFTAPNAYCTSR